MPKFEEYPKWKYAEAAEPRLIADRAEEDELEGEWFDKPDLTNHEPFDHDNAPGHGVQRLVAYREYPKMMGDGVTVVDDEDAERAWLAANGGEVADTDDDGDEKPPVVEPKGKQKKAKPTGGDDLL